VHLFLIEPSILLSCPITATAGPTKPQIAPPTGDNQQKFDVPNPSPAMLVTITTMQAGRPVNSYFSHSVIRLVLEFLRLKQYMHTLLGDRFHSGPLNKDLTQVKVFRN